MNYLVYIVLICAAIYRVLKYSTFFRKNVVSIKISKKMSLLISIEVFLFLLSVLCSALLSYGHAGLPLSLGCASLEHFVLHLSLALNCLIFRYTVNWFENYFL